MDGGHFIASTSSSIRFDERNINAQCLRCNRFDHGNGTGYFIGMEKKYGRAVVDELMAQKGKTKIWEAWELEELIELYKTKLKEYI